MGDFPHAALIGRVSGSTLGDPFFVGSYHHIESIDQSGPLLLNVNDRGPQGNTGRFTARIQVAMP